jgi:hypothetical protein
MLPRFMVAYTRQTTCEIKDAHRGVTCIFQHLSSFILFLESHPISKGFRQHSSLPSSYNPASANSDYAVTNLNMPRALTPVRDSIARSLVVETFETTSPEERPQRKIFWNDDFDNLIDLPSHIERLPSSHKPPKQMCRTQIDATSSSANIGSSFEGSIQAMEQRSATLTDSCFDGGLNDRLENVFMVACLLLLANGAAMAIYLRLRRWRPVRDVHQDPLVTASTILGPISKTEV